ncbi:MAG: hypothetical protein KAH03_01660 [Cocleimonas sp.]|nr:hypothetical protein [Cocleimonas sp.]
MQVNEDSTLKGKKSKNKAGGRIGMALIVINIMIAREVIAKYKHLSYYFKPRVDNLLCPLTFLKGAQRKLTTLQYLMIVTSSNR